jgi:hypothetical protein
MALLDALVHELPVRPEAIPKVERIRRVAELEAELDRFERDEETLISRAASDGLDILRRPDASPAAVLGVAVVKAAAAA